MTSDRPASRARHRLRAGLGLLLALGPLMLGPLAPAAAQEPLVLRIRAQPDPVEAARAAREAVWARSQARARAAIASVCTGCLAPWRPPEAAVAPGAPNAGSRVAALADPAAPAPAGLESDPTLGASDATSDPPSRERHP